MPRLPIYVLLALLDADSRLIETRVVLKAQASDKIAPFVFIEAECDAPDPRTAYSLMMYGLLAAPDRLSGGFWSRVAYVPRIRIAALRHTGLRGIGPLLHMDYRRPSEEGTVGGVL